MKENYYFSHDSNALTDPKILSMRCDYGMEGYGIFWAIVEMLRVQEEYKLELNKLNFNALKMLCMTQTDIEEFVNKCIKEYSLFETDEKYFWSDSLCKRMEKKDDVKQKRKCAADKRWDKKETDTNAMQNDTNAMQMQCKQNANAMQNDTKESKEKESKENKEKDIINTSCSEPKGSKLEEEIIIELTLNDKSKYPVCNADIEKWGELYPAVDVIQELRKMEGWIEANPQRRKTKTGIKRFINSWLSKVQDKGGNLVGMPHSTTLSNTRKQSKFINYEQRDWDFEKLNRLKAEILERNTKK